MFHLKCCVQNKTKKIKKTMQNLVLLNKPYTGETFRFTIYERLTNVASNKCYFWNFLP